MEKSTGARLEIREAVPADLPSLHAINEASTPGVGPVTEAMLARLMAMASLTRVAENGSGPLGFILCMTEGCDYASPNYRWLSARYERFAYCDRIAVAAEARGLAIGARLYAEAAARLRLTRNVLLCEVNLAPPNPGSLRFHERLGFRCIGEGWLPDRSYGVAYMEKTLD